MSFTAETPRRREIPSLLQEVPEVGRSTLPHFPEFRNPQSAIRNSRLPVPAAHATAATHSAPVKSATTT